MLPEIARNFKFDENFKRPLYEDLDYCNQLTCSEIVSCGAMDVGMLFHRYSATQLICYNSDIPKNKKYFENKWKSRKKELEEKTIKIRKTFAPRKNKFPSDKTNVFFYVVKAGLHKW